MPRSARATPRDLAPGWPNQPSVDPIAEIARRFAENLRTAIGSKSVRSAAEVSGVSHSTLLGIMEGRTWPDLETIAKVERGVATDLWPGRIK